MPTLHINDFSCIREADFVVAPVNVIIGPQGSGKSVTTKLLYFFADVLTNFVSAAERGESIESYKKHLGKQFAVWFPPSAWGKGRFRLSYTAGPFEMRVMRRQSAGKPSDDVTIRFSDYFNNLYDFSVNLLDSARQEVEADVDADQLLNMQDVLMRAKAQIRSQVGGDLEGDYLSQQTFIPAGRAFFTTIGRMVAGFEQAGSLDPVTIKFARLFANLRDRGTRSYIFRRDPKRGEEFLLRRASFMSQLFGGELKFENESEYVQAKDGRKIPFASLSSGQQELLPMWSLIDYFNEMDFMRVTSPSSRHTWRRELLYIEEPEAHLFPSAQSLLMEYLIGSVANNRSENRQRSLILTTHSPYIMAKLNVFLKAGQLARRKKRNQDINEIVPRDCWLNEQQLSAFAIEDGRLVSLLDDEGFIDGTYLDGVSEVIDDEYSSLLEIETEMAGR